jgi:ribonucleases P/MRP protein subunit RPP40
LRNRSFEVILDNTHSKPRSVPSGVIQGTVIGVLLFSVFINKLPGCIPDDTDCEIFADDNKVYSTLKDKLEHAAVSVQKWCLEWDMKLAPDKFQFIVIKRRRAVYDMTTLNFGNVSISPEHCVKDLGVTIADTLEPAIHIAEIARKAQRKCNLIMRTLRIRKPEIFSRSFRTMIRPTLEYASTVWSPHYQKDIDLIKRSNVVSPGGFSGDVAWLGKNITQDSRY